MMLSVHHFGYLPLTEPSGTVFTSQWLRIWRTCLTSSSFIHWRSQYFVLRGPENRGAEFETPKGRRGMGSGYPPPQPTIGGLGERCKLPQRGPKTDFGAFWAWKNESGDKFDVFVIFTAHILESNLQGIDIFFSFAGGGLDPLGPPSGYATGFISLNDVHDAVFSVHLLVRADISDIL